MKEIAVPCRRGDSEGLLTHLRRKVFHLTTLSAYRSILNAGKILHNKDGRFDLNTSSENSFGRLMGYVCLFDLRNDHPDIIESALSCYPFLGPHWFSRRKNGWMVSELAYLLLDPACLETTIPNSRAYDHYKATGMWHSYIPKVEVWMKGHVPLDWIDTVLLTKLTERAPAPGSHRGMLLRLERQELKSMGGAG